MAHHNCLNCGKKLTDKFCAGCGQKADTHRITFKNFICHDVLHGTFHIDRGMLFTAKQALVRPGVAALDYIAGRRKQYYNVFLLVLVTIGLILFFRHFYSESVIMLGDTIKEKTYLNEASRRMDEIISQKSKFFIFLFVPSAALSSFILFEKKKLNLAEHSIISGMVLLGMLLITLIANILFCFNLIKESTILTFIINYFTIPLVILYIAYGYYNAFSADYSRLGIAIRIILLFALLFFQAVILFLVVFGFASDWKFGKISVNPFG